MTYQNRKRDDRAANGALLVDLLCAGRLRSGSRLDVSFLALFGGAAGLLAKTDAAQDNDGADDEDRGANEEEPEEEHGEGVHGAVVGGGVGRVGGRGEGLAVDSASTRVGSGSGCGSGSSIRDRARGGRGQAGGDDGENHFEGEKKVVVDVFCDAKLQMSEREDGDAVNECKIAGKRYDEDEKKKVDVQEETGSRDAFYLDFHRRRSCPE